MAKEEKTDCGFDLWIPLIATCIGVLLVLGLILYEVFNWVVYEGGWKIVLVTIAILLTLLLGAILTSDQ